MNRKLVEHVALPLLYRRSWPGVRAALRRMRDVEALDADAVAARSLGHALATARRAAARSPFLRRLYAAAAQDPGRMRTAADFHQLPVLTKNMLREHAPEIVCDDVDVRDLTAGATGGSTGVPSPYYHDDGWWASATAAALRGDEWTGWRVGDRHATIWGTDFDESWWQRAHRRFSHRARNLLFLPGFDLSADALDAKLRRLRRWRPRLVSGYSSLLLSVGEEMLRRGSEPPRPLAVVSSAEPLPPDTRRIVEQAFGAPVFDRYGCRELGLIAQECEAHEGLHVFSDRVYVEVEKEGRPAEPGETGRVLATLLDNPSFPMVRYEVGDLATVMAPTPCSCGRPYARLARVDGRQLDVLWKADGSPVTGVFFPHLMKDHEWVRAFQIVQDEHGDVDVRVIPAGRPEPAQRRAVLRAIRRTLGDGLAITLRFVRDVDRTPSGKVRVTQSLYRPRVTVRRRRKTRKGRR